MATFYSDVSYGGDAFYKTKKATMDLQKPAAPDSTSSELSSSQLALVDSVPPLPFVSVEHMSKLIDARREKLELSSESVYMSFSPVDAEDLISIEKKREEERPHYRITYFNDIQTLIIKIPSAQHESAHAGFFSEITRQASMMGMARRECHAMGATTIKTDRYSDRNMEGRSSKEGDSSFRNKIFRPPSDSWPTVVIESGNSESLAQLRMDAHWWIQTSRGQVRIVILIKVNKGKHKIQIIKYISSLPLGYPNTRNPSVIAKQVSDISIDQSCSPSQIQGAPLTLEFNEMFERRPNPPREKDVTFTSQDLDEWAKDIW